jgi:hypothetical protein
MLVAPTKYILELEVIMPLSISKANIITFQLIYFTELIYRINGLISFMKNSRQKVKKTNVYFTQKDAEQQKNNRISK